MATTKLILTLLTSLALASAYSRPRYESEDGATEPKQMDDQSLTCSAGPDGFGDSVTLTDYVSDLSYLGWDNRFSSCCFDGIWLLYDDYDYNTDSFSAEEFDAWGENYCTTFDSRFDDLASSVRFSGAPDGYKYPTLNLYEGERFMGDEHYYYDYTDDFTMDNVMSSAIVTGCDPWTIFEYDDFDGDSVCLFPSDTQNCYPGFFPFEEDLGGMANKGSSALRGCYSKTKVVGKTFKDAMEKRHD